MKTILTLILTTTTLCLSAQTIERQVIGSLGNTSTTAGVTITSTLGEVAVATKTSTNIMLTEGYQQANDSNSVSIAEIANIPKLKLYPNPTTNTAKLEITANFNSATTIAVYSLDGKLISSNSLALTSGIESSIQIDVSNQA
ncbi:MAG: T9SS type A sorting domain-containing protein, partial [Flavobacteriales bacterium]